MDTVTANTELIVGSKKLKLKLVVPAAEIPPESLVPTLQELSNIITDGVEEKVAKQGVEISCKKGCGACCRQHVPISPAEARLLAALVDNLPEPGQSIIRERFKKAAQKLRESGVMDPAMNYHRLVPEEIKAMVKAYFKLQIACPFLDEESCSIHPFRPLICREYLVISDPVHCSSLDEEHLERLLFPVSVAGAFASMSGVHREGENHYIPLIMALERTEEHADLYQTRTGPEWIQQFFKNLSGADIPDWEAPEGSE